MNNPTKLLSSLFIFVVFGVSFFVPNFATADHTTAHTISQLQEQIEQLQARIRVLQQQLSIPQPIPGPSVCPVFSRTLYRGVSDSNTGGEVTKLQKILAADPTVYPEGLVTGYYGSLTEKAVQSWQAKQGIASSGSSATTGYGVVGPQTRARMIIACPTPPPIPTDSLIIVLSPNGGEQWALGSNQTIQWSSGPFAIGSSLAEIAFIDIDLLSWSTPCTADPCPLSFAPSFSTALARKVPNIGSFSWSVGKNPSGGIIPTGLYVVRISNSENSGQYDQSDAAFSIVKEDSGNLPPTISGVSGPSVLKVGEIGKWEVKASDPEQGPLMYSVVWGDETIGTGIAERVVPSAPGIVSQTATFTHVYSKAGVYTPTFTITDNGGLSAKTSISVSVSGGTSTNSFPTINATPAVPSDIKVNQSVSFSWSATDADGDNLSWSVSWGDGTGMAGACTSPNPQNKQNWTFTASHAWAASGIYTVKATVNDCRGGSDEHAFNVNVGSSIQPFITVLSPNGGETWTKGTTQTIKWQDNTPIPPCPTGAACLPYVLKYYDIKLTHYYSPCISQCPVYPYIAPYTIAKSVYGSSYGWSVGKILDTYGTGDTAPDGSYTIQVCQTGSTTCDSSDSYFKIVSGIVQESIKVISPNGGETWQIGSTQTINWDSANAPSGSWVALFLTNGPYIAQGLPVKGSYSWKVPSQYCSGDVCGFPMTEGSDYKIEARLYTGPALCVGLCPPSPQPTLLTRDYSNAPFSIIK